MLILGTDSEQSRDLSAMSHKCYGTLLQHYHGVGNGTGLKNPCGSWVWVVMGTGVGMDLPTHELQN